MSDEEFIEHPPRDGSSDATTQGAVQAFADANEESGFGAPHGDPQLA